MQVSQGVVWLNVTSPLDRWGGRLRGLGPSHYYLFCSCCVSGPLEDGAQELIPKL